MIQGRDPVPALRDHPRSYRFLLHVVIPRHRTNLPERILAQLDTADGVNTLAEYQARFRRLTADARTVDLHLDSNILKKFYGTNLPPKLKLDVEARESNRVKC